MVCVLTVQIPELLIYKVCSFFHVGGEESSDMSGNERQKAKVTQKLPRSSPCLAGFGARTQGCSSQQCAFPTKWRWIRGQLHRGTAARVSAPLPSSWALYPSSEGQTCTVAKMCSQPQCPPASERARKTSCMWTGSIIQPPKGKSPNANIDETGGHCVW